ncbi:MAG: hypothetical protein ACSHYF_07820, partial [Verrucomicrobiaceae bacterium]
LLVGGLLDGGAFGWGGFWMGGLLDGGLLVGGQGWGVLILTLVSRLLGFDQVELGEGAEMGQVWGVVDPYQSPQAEPLVTPGPAQKRVGIAALCWYAMPIFGLGIGAVLMMRVFGRLADDGSADPSRLTGDIARVLLVIAPSVVLGLVGAMKVGLVIWRGECCKRWFFWTSLMLSGIYCFLLFPFGLLVGGGVIAMLLSRRGQFEWKSAKGTGE